MTKIQLLTATVLLARCLSLIPSGTTAVWYKLKKGFIIAYPQFKVYVHLRCYMVELEIKAGIQKDVQWGFSHIVLNILTYIYSGSTYFCFYMVRHSKGREWISLSFQAKGLLHWEKVTQTGLVKSCLLASMYTS